MKERGRVPAPAEQSLLRMRTPPKIKAATADPLQTGLQIKGAISASRMENICYNTCKDLPLKVGKHDRHLKHWS